LDLIVVFKKASTTGVKLRSDWQDFDVNDLCQKMSCVNCVSCAILMAPETCSNRCRACAIFRQVFRWQLTGNRHFQFV